MSYGASEMNPMKCKCNSCTNDLNGNGVTGCQTCSTKIKTPKTVVISDHVNAFLIGCLFGAIVGFAFVGAAKYWLQ